MAKRYLHPLVLFLLFCFCCFVCELVSYHMDDARMQMMGPARCPVRARSPGLRRPTLGCGTLCASGLAMLVLQHVLFRAITQIRGTPERTLLRSCFESCHLELQVISSAIWKPLDSHTGLKGRDHVSIHGHLPDL